MNTKTITIAALLAASTLTTGQRPLAAQSYHMPATPEKGVWIEAGYADVDGIDQSFGSSFWFASGRLPLSAGLSAIADVPFAYSRASFEGGPKDSSTILGNPMVGLEYGYASLVFEGTVRLPVNTIDEETFADVLGGLGDYQRAEAFSDEVVPVSGAVTYVLGLDGGPTLQGRAGVVGLFRTGDEESESDNDALLDYGILGTYPVGPARLGLGAFGRWLATEDEGDFGDNSVHQLALSGDLALGGVRPGLSIRVPLDSDYRDVVSSTISLYLQVPLR